MGFRVADEYRINDLYRERRGFTVCVRDSNGRIFEYDYVISPWAYVKKIKREKPNTEAWWYKDKPEKIYSMTDPFKKNPYKSDRGPKTYTVYVKYKDGKVIANKNIAHVHPYMAKVKSNSDVVTCWYES